MVTIQEISRNRSRVSVRLDNGEIFWLTQSDVYAEGCYEGKKYDPESFYQWIRICQYPRALNHAVSMLARRPCSTGEIRRRLMLHHYTEEVTELVLYKLEKENLLNDQEFSELWVQQRSRKYGSRRIRQELRVKGVPESTAEKALSSVSDEEMLESATSLAVKAWSRAKPGDDPRKTRQRIISSLVRKGFDWDLARQASDTAESETIF